MKKVKYFSVLLSCLLLVGCNNSTTDTTSNNNKNSTNTTNNASYITDNVKITSADDALKRLKDGNSRFVNNHSELINVTSERREQLVDGQSPYAVVISCSDSRVTPSLIFNVGLGELFDIRIAGNVVDNDALGSIEYGVEHLHSPLIVVIGHEKCGAVTAAYDRLKNGTPVEGNINSLVDKIEPHIKDSDSLNDAIEDNAEAVLEQIEADPIVAHLISEGKVKAVKAHYSLDGTVTFDD